MSIESNIFDFDIGCWMPVRQAVGRVMGIINLQRCPISQFYCVSANARDLGFGFHFSEND